MKTLHIDLDYQEKNKPQALAVGFFDGLHLGHMSLLQEALHSGLRPSVLSFESDFKAKIFHSERELLLSDTEKEKALSWLGFDSCYLLKSEEKVIQAKPEEFLSLLEYLCVKKLIVGKDFTFGAKGKGTPELLLSLREKGIDVIIKDLVEIHDEKISSSLIKEKIKEGDIEAANQLLGYPFYLENPVIHGLKNGKKIGYPTANQEYPKEKVRLKEGVYRTRTLIEGKSYPSMTNIGTHPTIHPLEKPIIETYIIGYDGNLYGSDIRVSFYQHLREQRKFSSLSELKAQLDLDIQACQK